MKQFGSKTAAIKTSPFGGRNPSSKSLHSVWNSLQPRAGLRKNLSTKGSFATEKGPSAKTENTALPTKH